MRKIFILFFFSFSFVSNAQDSLDVNRKSYSLVKNDMIHNVVYRGLRNPINIAVPNAKSFKVYGEGVSLLNDGSYNLSPQFGRTVSVFVESVLQNDSVVIDEHIFKIKGVGPPEINLNGYYYNIDLKKEDLKNAIVSLEIPDSDYKHDFIVNEFEIFILKRKKKKIVLNVIGNCIDENAYYILLKLKKGTTFYIDITNFQQKKFQAFFCKIDPIAISLLD